MLVKVIPSYSEMFNDLGTELPGITKAVVAMSDFVTGYWYIVIAVIAAIVIAIKLYKQLSLIHISSSREIVLAELLVCSVLTTRCPVIDACTAICAVS